MIPDELENLIAHRCPTTGRTRDVCLFVTPSAWLTECWPSVGGLVSLALLTLAVASVPMVPLAVAGSLATLLNTFFVWQSWRYCGPGNADLDFRADLLALAWILALFSLLCLLWGRAAEHGRDIVGVSILLAAVVCAVFEGWSRRSRASLPARRLLPDPGAARTFLIGRAWLPPENAVEWTCSACGSTFKAPIPEGVPTICPACHARTEAATWPAFHDSDD